VQLHPFGIDFDALEVALEMTLEVEEQTVGLQILDPLVVEEEEVVVAVPFRQDLCHIAPVVAAVVVSDDVETVEHDVFVVVAYVGGGSAAAGGTDL